MIVSYDAEADLIYVEFEFPETKLYGEQIDDDRILQRDEAGQLLGVVFLAVSKRFNLEGLPRGAEIVDELRRFRAVTGELEPLVPAK